MRAVVIALLIALAASACGGQPLQLVPDAGPLVVCTSSGTERDLCAACRIAGADIAASCPDGTVVCDAPLPDGCAVKTCASCP